MDAHGQRAERGGAPALTGQPAADHDLLRRADLDLDPRRRPAARLVRGVQALGHDPLQPLGLAGLQQRRAVSLAVRGRPPARPVELECRQQLAAVRVGQRQGGVALQPQQVEDDVCHRHVAHTPLHRGRRRQVHPRLEPLEARPATRVEGHDLAIQDGAPRAQCLAQPANLRVAGGEVGAVAAGERHVPRVYVGDRPYAVPLDLECVAGVVAGQLAHARQHRGDGVRHGTRGGVGRRVHPVDHPVLAAGLEQDVAAAHALALQATRSPRRNGTSRPHRCRSPRSPWSRRRRSRPGSRRESPGTRAGGPRCGPPAGSPPDGPGHPWAGPTTPARRRAPGAGPSAGCWRDAPG